VACKVKVNRHGNLAFRIYAPTLPNNGAWEGTDLADTPENRRFAKAQAVLISREIKKGTFDYLKGFLTATKRTFSARMPRTSRRR
jgi:Arm domain-containing DNA-binding protein